MTSEELQSIIAAGLPCEHIELSGDGGTGTPPWCPAPLKASA
jgi:hypothetical protein